jgi:hypothetical protein
MWHSDYHFRWLGAMWTKTDSENYRSLEFTKAIRMKSHFQTTRTDAVILIRILPYSLAMGSSSTAYL